MARKKRPAKTIRNTYKKKQSKTPKSNSEDSVTTANRIYKDSLFTELFCSDVTAEENLRSLYNVLHPEDQLTEQDVIKKKMLENVFFNSLRNDITGLFKQRVIVFGEHQSTINNNIPVRLFMYAGRIYEQLLDGHKKYETELIPIPTPGFYVFYIWKGKEVLSMLTMDWDYEEALEVACEERERKAEKKKDNVPITH